MPIQFTKLPSRNQLSAPVPEQINGESICECCKAAPVLGYAGNGTVVSKLCGKCWRRNSSGKDKASKPQFLNREGRS